MQIYQKTKKPVQQRYKISVKKVFGYNKIEENNRAEKAVKEVAIEERVRTAK